MNKDNPSYTGEFIKGSSNRAAAALETQTTFLELSRAFWSVSLKSAKQRTQPKVIKVPSGGR